MRGRTVRLTATRTRFSSSDDDLEPERLALEVPAALWDKAVGLAETQGFRAPRTGFFPSQTARFAEALRRAINTRPVAPRRLSLQTPLHQLSEFFRLPAHKKVLLAIVKLVSSGGSLDVTYE